MKLGAWLKWGILIKKNRLNFGEAFRKGGQGSFCSEMFYKWLRKFNTNAKIISSSKIFLRIILNILSEDLRIYFTKFISQCFKNFQKIISRKFCGYAASTINLFTVIVHSIVNTPSRLFTICHNCTFGGY